MRFAASLTATGILGFLLLEALKILLAPAAAWLLAALMIAAKFALLGLGATLVVATGVFVFRRVRRNRDGLA